MGAHKKTTIEISEPLLNQARRLAARDGTTLRALVEEGLRKVLAEKKRPDGFRLRRASFKCEGMQPQAAGAGWDRIREMAYEGHGG